MSAPVLFGPNNRATNLQNGFLNSDGSTVKNDGLINYIQNPGFENGTTNGWSLSRVTLTNNFPSAPSGSISAGVTFVPYQTTVLSGNYSGAFTSTTSFVAGDSLVSSTMTIDPKYQSQVISFSFSYKVDAGASLGVFAGNNTNTFGIAIYDVTNATFVQPSSGLWSISGYAGTAAGQFQTASNGSQYQFAIFANTGVTGAFRFLVDDFFWGASVPAGNDGRVLCTTVNYAGQALGAAALTKFTTPTVVIDTTSSFDATAKRWNCPAAGFYCLVFSATNAGGTSSQLSSVLYVNGASVDESDGIANATTQTAANTTVLSLKSGDYVELYGFTQSAATLSGKLRIFRLAGPTSGDEGRVVAMRANGQPPTGTLANAYNNTVYGTLISDSAGAYNPATGIYTIQQSGYFDVSAASAVTATYAAGALLGVTINANGTIIAEGVQVSSAAYTGGLYVQANMKAIYLTAGTTVNVKTLVSGSSPSWINSYSLNYFTLSRVSGPNATSAQESVNCRYASGVGTSLAANTNTLLPFATKSYDSNSLWTGTQFNVTNPGKYAVCAQMQLTSTTLSNGQTVFIMIYKNGSLYSQGTNTYGNGTAQFYMSTICDDVPCIAGDYIQIYGLCSVATTLNPYTGTNFVTVKKVGN